jgi:excisionase family DNA binding protein
MTPEVLSIRQAAAYLGITPDTLYKHVGEGTVPGFKIGNRWRFKKSILDTWIERSIAQHQQSFSSQESQIQ